ncbi:MAG: glycoside hydrolase, partial [Thermoplasmata archaeon]|nr:glycoside hydrolase [Thermoplasmata archaeon]
MPVIVLLLLLVGAPSLGAPSAGVARSPHGVLAHPLDRLLPHAATPRAGAVTPHGIPTAQGTFYALNSTFASPPQNQTVCEPPPPTTYQYCYPQAQSPSVLTLANGDIGVGYAKMTTLTSSSCPAATAGTVSRIEFSDSSNGGANYSAPVDIGNNSCPYINGIEPSFAVSSSGTIFGAFVEENFTGNTALGGTLSLNYLWRPTDALGFTSSSDNGSTFSSVVTIVSTGNVALPRVAAFGNTVYIVYENITNSSTNYTVGNGLGNAPAIAVHFLYSSDAGASWNGPYTLPGENATSGYNAMTPAIAVNSAGRVAVTYVTNRSCIEYCYYLAGARYADDVVVVTSNTNGTSWKGPYLVDPALGEDVAWLYYPSSSYYIDGLLFESPQVSIAYAANGTTLYIAMAGTFNRNSTQYNGNYWTNGIFSAASYSSGITWGVATVKKEASDLSADQFYGPSVGTANGQVYVSYAWFNETCCSGGSYLVGSTSWWVAQGTDGLHWTNLTLLSVAVAPYPYYFYFEGTWPGTTSSVGFSDTGSPVIGFPQAEPYTYTVTCVLT